MTDCVSREAAVGAALDYRVDVIENDYDRGYQKAVEDIAKELNSIPAADVRPAVRGEWRVEDRCPVCGEDRYKGLDADLWACWEPPFCPQCGADMRGVKPE